MIKVLITTIAMTFASQALAGTSVVMFGKSVAIKAPQAKAKSSKYRAPGFCDDFSGNYIGQCEGDQASHELKIQQWNCESLMFGDQYMSVGALDIKTEVTGQDVYTFSQHMSWEKRNKIAVKSMGHIQFPMNGHNFVFPFTMDASAELENGMLTIAGGDGASHFKCVYLKN